jgi:hypothetical protein
MRKMEEYFIHCKFQIKHDPLCQSAQKQDSQKIFCSFASQEKRGEWRKQDEGLQKLGNNKHS